MKVLRNLLSLWPWRQTRPAATPLAPLRPWQDDPAAPTQAKNPNNQQSVRNAVAELQRRREQGQRPYDA